MKIYGLIGNPLGHSFSQKYFDEKFRCENIKNAAYLNFEIADLNRGIMDLKSNSEIKGLNVTIPYKLQILSFLDEISPACKEINACNCIKIHNKNWTGYNTDVTGFEKTFTKHLKLNHTKALILGTGGSSKAVAYVMKKLKIEYLLVSRKKDLNAGIIGYDEIDATMMHDYPVITNTTPLGMFPDVETLPPLPYQYVTAGNYFFDLVYNPGETLFLSKAKEKGAAIKNGEKMLIIQAEESWKIWNQN